MITQTSDNAARYSWPFVAPKPIGQLLIYIASPYTIGDQVLNVRRQIEAADTILQKGHIPFCPCLTHFWHFISPKSWEEWFRIDSVIVPRCDALLRLPGESRGADREVALAKEHGIPVYYDINEIPIGG